MQARGKHAMTDRAGVVARSLPGLLVIALAVALVGCVEPAPSQEQPEPDSSVEAAEPAVEVEEDSPETVVTNPPPTDEAPQADTLPAFEPAECAFDISPELEVECGYLSVLEDRSQPEGTIIRLHVAIFRSPNVNPAPDPVIHLVGGPGASLLDAAAFYIVRGGGPILWRRDYILFNQRGTAYAEPSLYCPGQAEFPWEAYAEQLSPEERDEREFDLLMDCQSDLIDQGINLAAYNSVENAADVSDLITALGYEEANLYGISYGTRLALAAMRDHPEHIRSVILDSVFPPQVNLDSELAPNAYRVLRELFDACASSSACSAAYPDLEQTFYAAIDILNSAPRPIELSSGTVWVDGDLLADAIFGMFYDTEALPWIPRVITRARQGDVSALQPALEATLDESAVSWGMHYSVECNEELPFNTYDEAAALAEGLPPQVAASYLSPFMYDVCEAWESGQADPTANEAVVSDIPTLVVAGRFDPVTPPAWAELAAETLSSSYYYQFPNVGHGVIRSDGCALMIALDFLDDPTTEPDSSCMDSLEEFSFR